VFLQAVISEYEGLKRQLEAVQKQSTEQVASHTKTLYVEERVVLC